MIAETILAASILLNPQSTEEINAIPVTPIETFIQMQQDIELQKERIEFLTNHNRDLTDSVEQLTDEKAVLEETINGLEAENTELRREIDSLKKAKEDEVKVANSSSSQATTQLKEASETETSSQGSWNTGEATAYGNFKDAMNGETGITADGWNLDNGLTYKGYKILAADPSIPFGTVVEIKLVDGTTFKGVVKDRGGAIKGNKFDIVMATREDCFDFGRQTIQYRITEEIVK